MSVIIKGMEMPKKGEYLMTLYVDSDGSAYIDVESFPEDKDKFEAIEVPPHGRLFDCDKVYQRLKRLSIANPYLQEQIDSDLCALVRCLETTPTFIEAEGE